MQSEVLAYKFTNRVRPGPVQAIHAGHQATEAIQKNALELLRPTIVRRNSSNECALTSFDNIFPLPVIKPEADPTPPTVLTLASNPEQLTYSIVCCRHQRKICRKGASVLVTVDQGIPIGTIGLHKTVTLRNSSLVQPG